MKFLSFLIFVIFIAYVFRKLGDNNVVTPLKRKGKKRNRDATFYESSDYGVSPKRSRDVNIIESVPIPTQVDVNPAPPPHKKMTYLSTATERKFHKALRESLPSALVIHCQVSLMALVQPIHRKHNSRTWAKRMDFVVTDLDNQILVVIELDDRTHDWESRKKRDHYVNEVLEGKHKLVRFKTQRSYADIDFMKELGLKSSEPSISPYSNTG